MAIHLSDVEDSPQETNQHDDQQFNRALAARLQSSESLSSLVRDNLISRDAVVRIPYPQYNLFSREGLCQAIRDGQLDWVNVYNPEQPEAKMSSAMVDILDGIYANEACRDSIDDHEFGLGDIIESNTVKQEIFSRISFSEEVEFTPALVRAVLDLDSDEEASFDALEFATRSSVRLSM